MERQTFQPGKLIIRQGNLGSSAFRILSGRVEVFVTRGPDRIVLGRLEPGEIFGEMGMIEDKPRSASVQALETTEVEIVTPQDFNELILKQPDQMVPFLKSFFERLRRANDRNFAPVAALPARAKGLPSAPPRGEVRILAGNAVSRERVQTPELTLAKFPFRIGRWSENAQADVFVSNDLLVRDDPPYQISRNHCAIEREGERYYLLDRGSALGTGVHGGRIGGIESQMTAPLQPGENEIQLGGADSPYRFRIIIG